MVAMVTAKPQSCECCFPSPYMSPLGSVSDPGALGRQAQMPRAASDTGRQISHLPALVSRNETLHFPLAWLLSPHSSCCDASSRNFSF